MCVCVHSTCQTLSWSSSHYESPAETGQDAHSLTKNSLRLQQYAMYGCLVQRGNKTCWLSVLHLGALWRRLLILWAVLCFALLCGCVDCETCNVMRLFSLEYTSALCKEIRRPLVHLNEATLLMQKTLA